MIYILCLYFLTGAQHIVSSDDRSVGHLFDFDLPSAGSKRTRAASMAELFTDSEIPELPEYLDTVSSSRSSSSSSSSSSAAASGGGQAEIDDESETIKVDPLLQAQYLAYLNTPESVKTDLSFNAWVEMKRKHTEQNKQKYFKKKVAQITATGIDYDTASQMVKATMLKRKEHRFSLKDFKHVCTDPKILTILNKDPKERSDEERRQASYAKKLYERSMIPAHERYAQTKKQLQRMSPEKKAEYKEKRQEIHKRFQERRNAKKLLQKYEDGLIEIEPERLEELENTANNYKRRRK
ncbi:hypothetical protein EBR77_03880 [bacterium]|nr:hypothetical protein [bacterium]NBX78728.1 hypothetical protein [bacterium]